MPAARACCRVARRRASIRTASPSWTTWRPSSTTSMPRRRAQELPLRTLMSEYAPGQYEITLLHRDDALRAIDDALLFKRLIRGVALRHGLTACFMAKPFADQAGSGMHMHVSVQDATASICSRTTIRREPHCCAMRSAVCRRTWPSPCCSSRPTRIRIDAFDT